MFNTAFVRLHSLLLYSEFKKVHCEIDIFLIQSIALLVLYEAIIILRMLFDKKKYKHKICDCLQISYSKVIKASGLAITVWNHVYGSTYHLHCNVIIVF